MDLTPDACMDNHWADQKSLGKRDRDDADAPENNGQPTPARLPCGSYLEVAKASPTKPKDLNQLFLKEKGPQAAAGDAKKTKKVDQTQGLQLNELSDQTGGELQRVDSEFDAVGIPMCHEMLKAMGYTHDEVHEYVANVESAPKEAPVVVLKILGKFNVNIFSEQLQSDLAKDLFAIATNKSQPGDKMEKFDIGVYQQFDKSGRKHSVLTVDCSPRMYNVLKGRTFSMQDKVGFANGELPVILFKGISLKEWVDEVGGVEARGTTFGLNVGPFPRAPNDDTVKKFEPLLKMYGDITHIIFYADRTITIGFALGDKTMPKARKPIPIFDGGIFAGALNPIHNIRIVGMQNCSYCPGIGEFHTGECEKNKAQMQNFLKRRKQTVEAAAERCPPSRPSRRGAASAPASGASSARTSRRTRWRWRSRRRRSLRPGARPGAKARRR